MPSGSGRGGPDRLNESMRQTLRRESIHIEPVMLTTDELDYELGIRQLQIPGLPRERTLRLRRALEMEQKMNFSPNESCYAFGSDAKSCQTKLQDIAKVLQADTFERPVIDRLKTALAHVEARSGRMYPNNIEEEGQVRELRMRAEEMINLFLTKLEDMARRLGARHRAVQAPSAESAHGADGTEARGGTASVEDLGSDRGGDFENRSRGPPPNSGNETIGNDGAPRNDTREMASFENAGRGQERQRSRSVGNEENIRAPSALPNRNSMSDFDTRSHARSAANTTTAPSVDWVEYTLPDEAVWDSFPPAGPLNSEQRRALDRPVQSGVDGSTFLQEWTATEGSANLDATRPSGGEPRSVRFGPNVTTSRNDRDYGYRDFQDTAYPEVQERTSLGGDEVAGRPSDASARSNTRSAGSIFGEQVRQNGSNSTRMSFENGAPHGSRGNPQQGPIHHGGGPGNGNQTYTVGRNENNQRDPLGQWIFVPYVSDDNPESVPRRDVPGQFVFLPYDVVDTWPAILNAIENRATVDYIGGERDDNRFRIGGQSRYGFRQKGVPVHKWNINFSGEEKLSSNTDLRVNEFLYQIECGKSRQHISDDEMLGQIGWLLTGAARTWYYAYFKTFRDWPTFVERMRRRFLSPYHEQDTLDTISRRPKEIGAHHGISEPYGDVIPNGFDSDRRRPHGAYNPAKFATRCASVGRPMGTEKSHRTRTHTVQITSK